MTSGAAGLKSVGQAIGDLFESPVECVGVEVEAEEKIPANDGKDVVACNPIAVGVAEADLGHGVLVVAPTERQGPDGARLGGEGGNDRYRFGDSLDHASTI
jgi:hypothetical protein